MPSKIVPKESVLAEWRAAEFKYRPKSLDWFVGIGLAALGLLIWAIFTLNFLFAILVITATLSLFLLSHRKPKTYKFRITEEAVWIEDRPLLFDALSSYWIFNFGDTKILSLKQKGRLASTIHISLPGEIEKIQNILASRLEEIEDHYSFADWLADWLRF